MQRQEIVCLEQLISEFCERDPLLRRKTSLYTRWTLKYITRQRSFTSPFARQHCVHSTVEAYGPQELEKVKVLQPGDIVLDIWWSYAVRGTWYAPRGVLDGSRKEFMDSFREVRYVVFNRFSVGEWPLS